MDWYPAACTVCSGDLHDDIEDKGWVTCFSCARSFGPKDVRLRDLTRAEIIQFDNTPAQTPLRRAA